MGFSSPQSFIITFYYSLAKQLWGLLMNFMYIKFSVQMFQPLIVIYSSSFVYYYLGCTSIYRPLSYPSRSLKPTKTYDT